VSATLRELADLVGGTLHGPPDKAILAARPLGEAGPDDVSFLESEKHLRHLKTSNAGALVAPEPLAEKLAADGRAVIAVADALAAFVAVFQKFKPPPAAPPVGVSPRAYVHPTARIGAGCTVMPFACVGENAVVGPRSFVGPGVSIGADCVIGADAVLHANCVLYGRTVVGDRVLIHAGAVLGADGFGYRFDNGRHVRVPHLGHVELGDDVEVGACTTIDRGTFEATRVANGTKIDNLVMIGHNCKIGRHNMLCSQVGIAGSSTTGDYVVMAGQVGIADHVHIGDGAVVGAGSGVPGDVPAGAKVFGYPAWPEKVAKRIAVGLLSLPEMIRDVRRLKRQCGLEEAPADQEAA